MGLNPESPKLCDKCKSVFDVSPSGKIVDFLNKLVYRSSADILKTEEFISGGNKVNFTYDADSTKTIKRNQLSLLVNPWG